MKHKLSWALLGFLIGLIGVLPAAQQVVNVGSAPNDGTGDPARTAFQKLNANDTELYSTTSTLSSGKQTVDADLTAIAGLSPSNDDVLQRKSGAWTNRTLSQLKTDLSLGNVENTALSTWAGSSNLTTLGTIGTGSWNATNIPLGKGGTGAALSDPDADRVLFWDDSAAAMSFLTVGSGLSITGTTLSATAGESAPIGATYVTQTPDGTLTNEQALSALATGILKSTTITGVLSIAVQGTDYYAPGGADVAVTDGGTGLSSGTSGGVPYFSGSTTIASSAALVANAIVLGGGAGTAPGVVSSLGTSGHVLTSAGAGVPPAFQAIPGQLIGFQVLTGAGTYTPGADVNSIVVVALGGGGGGAGAGAGTGGGGGGAGGYALLRISSLAANYAFSVGAAGAGGATGVNDGADGVSTTFGTALLTAFGGKGGLSQSFNGLLAILEGGAQSSLPTGGDINVPGNPGGWGIASDDSTFAGDRVTGGTGAGSQYGAGGKGAATTSSAVAGGAAAGYGAGGGGGISKSGSTAAGGNGAPGTLFVWEYS